MILSRFRGFMCTQIFLETRIKKDRLGKALASCGWGLSEQRFYFYFCYTLLAEEIT